MNIEVVPNHVNSVMTLIKEKFEMNNLNLSSQQQEMFRNYYLAHGTDDTMKEVNRWIKSFTLLDSMENKLDLLLEKVEGMNRVISAKR